MKAVHWRWIDRHRMYGNALKLSRKYFTVQYRVDDIFYPLVKNDVIRTEKQLYVWEKYIFSLN